MQNSERKLNDKIQKKNNELECLMAEREGMRRIMNESINKSSELLNEKNNLEKELVIKINQIENLKNSNLLLHKNIVINHKNEKSSELIK